MVFVYFVAPDGFVIENTARSKRVDRNCRVGGPADGAWPPRRKDQWEIGIGPMERMKEAPSRIGRPSATIQPQG